MKIENILLAVAVTRSARAVAIRSSGSVSEAYVADTLLHNHYLLPPKSMFVDGQIILIVIELY